MMITSALVFADVAPMQYRGWTLSPRFDSQVRLVSETVDIHWGDVCKVKAVFNLANHLDTALTMKIGFPVNFTYLKKRGRSRTLGTSRNESSPYMVNSIYDFTFTLNGITLSETDIPERRGEENEEQWYGWHCIVQPGQNTIHLSCHVCTNPTYGYSWQDTLHYVLHTGTFWKDKIDSAVVTVHFPGGIAAEQIHSKTKPAGFELVDSCVAWWLYDFEPTYDHNIHLRITGFEAYREMLELRTAISNPRADVKAKLDAAVFFAGLTFAKGLNFTAPADIDSAYYCTKVLPRLSSDERRVFQQNYGRTKYRAGGLLKKGKQYDAFSSNEELQHIIKSALLRTGYYENVIYDECRQFVELSQLLFREVVTQEPEMADAWLAYVENAYGIHPEGCNPCKPGFSLRTGGYFQNRLAVEAYKQCPNNLKIKAW